MLIRDLEAIYVVIMFSSDICIPYTVLHVRHFFFVLYICLDYNPSQENGGVNQRLEKLEHLINTGTNIA